MTMPTLRSREDYIDYLESVSSGSSQDFGSLNANLVKSYMVETAYNHDTFQNPAHLLARATGLRSEDVGDSSMCRLHDKRGVVAVVEGTDTRFPVIHSTIKVQHIDKLVNDAVMSTPWIDHVWLSGRFFDGLWKWTRDTCDPNRIARLKFSFTSRYEFLGDRTDGSLEDEHLSDEEDESDDNVDNDIPMREVRRSKFEVEDYVAVLDQRIQEMRQIHNPLQSTIRMRIPSGVHGAHEVYHNGKITNRSPSFAEQRKMIRLIMDMYKSVTENTEEQLWYQAVAEQDRDGACLTGLPVLLNFPEPLSLSTLHRWAEQTFTRRRNIFRLGGEPMWSGADRTRLHVYGVDRHLWQPISLEATRHYILALLPVGTCGNTVNRLLTNVQRYLTPSVEAWIGDRPYDELLATSVSRAA